jgi:hypothetical protein
MSKMARRRRSKGDRELDRLIKKINKTKAPSRNDERRQTARIKAHDVSSDATYTVKSEDRDPVKTVKRTGLNTKPRSLADRVKRNLKTKRAREQNHAEKVEVTKASPIRREIPRPQELTALMAPPLPPRTKGSKPNIVSLVYAFRAFQQFSHAYTRRKLGDPVGREIYYQEMKQRFRDAMRDADLEDAFDWRDF